MSAQSTAYISCTVNGTAYIYHFTGVTSIHHSLTLDINKTSSQETDIVNGASNQPNQIELSIIETDVEHSPGWAASMLNVLTSLKKRRLLCRVVTAMAVYDNMLLTEVSADEDADNQYGWAGKITFTEYIPKVEAAATKTNNNSSSRTSTGSSGSKELGSTLIALITGLR